MWVPPFQSSGQLGPKCHLLRNTRSNRAEKVLGYSRPKNRAGKPRNTGLFQGANRNSPTRISAAFSASVPGSFCGFPRPCTARSSRPAAPRERRACRTPHRAWYQGEAPRHRWTLPAPGQEEGRSPESSGSRSPSTISPAYSRSSPEGGTGPPRCHSWRTFP